MNSGYFVCRECRGGVCGGGGWGGAFWEGEETVVEGQSELLITRAEADVAEWYPHL